MIRMCVVAGALLLAAGCGGGASSPSAKTVTATATPSAAVDANARAACNQLTRARVLRVGSESEKPADSYGMSTSEMQAKSAELKALDLALKSSVLKLQQIGADADASALQSWCQEHQL